MARAFERFEGLLVLELPSPEYLVHMDRPT